MEEFNEWAIKEYKRLMNVELLAENEEELTELLILVRSHGLYFDYDRINQKYYLVHRARNIEELIERVIGLEAATFVEYIHTVDRIPEQISNTLYAAYQQLEIARTDLTKLKQHKKAENRE